MYYYLLKQWKLIIRKPAVKLHLSLLNFNLLVFGSGNLEKSRTS